MRTLKSTPAVVSVIIPIVVILLIGVMFYGLNYYTPLFADDYSYSFSFKNGERITSVSQIVDSQISHYSGMNGRVITHFLAQVFLLLGDSAFNVINTVFFLALIFVTYFHAVGTFRSFSLVHFVLITMLLFLCTPAFGQSFLWITGAANYLYGIFIILCILIPYRIQAKGKSKRYPAILEILVAMLYFPFGVIAGWTNENTSVAMIVMIIAFIAFYCLKKIRLHLWNFTGGIGAVIGCILMLTAPGTSKRMADAGGSGGISQWIRRAILTSATMITILQLIVLLFAVLITVYIYQKRHLIVKDVKTTVSNFQECSVMLIYLLGFLASVYSMIIAPWFSGRVWSGPVIYLLIALLNFCTIVDISGFKMQIGKSLVISFLTVLCLCTYLNSFLGQKQIYVAYQQRELAIQNAISAGEKSVRIPDIRGWSPISCFDAAGDLNADSNKWPNTAIAKYYGIDEVIREP